MQSTHTIVLHAVFHLARANERIDASTIGVAAGISATRAGAALCALERDGLVDATRARLTMLGLARAMVTGAARTGGGGLRVPAVAVVHGREEAEPLAARSDYPPAMPASL